ncbi:hypothetical protein K788_0009113 [Paraburkholderia caribensis MBA4]|uniref:Uncharacterized protein n=1 Tax=Paraburkholderia caribensis MBA4 TaxID=1323664 RepID=A0A0P0RE55_9BURK|nr:hypothetical protein K788_0009113 [Paraburkholderia caribensis MBA4]
MPRRNDFFAQRCEICSPKSHGFFRRRLIWKTLDLENVAI